MCKYELETRKILRKLGLNGTFTGYWYLIDAVLLCLENSIRLTYVCKGIYAEIANKYHVSVATVERSIGRARDYIYYHGNKELLNEILGYKLDRIPCNSVFIDAVFEYVVENC